ncbi:hypothetical protein PSHT_00703 [Puccinia striiformis]|uniref:Exoribonuclease phosphorolytic domain-containing protein n=1 Tax=Puccinia striiformis TaxID=27350 RepID=A0A2S4WMB6_9BASI|nr:hypothetical protein PSHT_00703 [Puccinia striiformis]
MASTLSLKNLQAAALQAGSTNNNNTTIDRRRFVGPDSSTPFLDFPSTSTTQPLAKTTDRADGRANHDSRPICIKVGVIAQANGSCYIESGNSKVICAVYGPKPPIVSAKLSIRNTTSYNSKICAIFESSIVEVHITVLEWDGPLSPGPCVLASMIPTTLALSRELHLLDPTSTEAESASAIFDLASIPAMGTVTHVGLRSTTDWKSAPIEFNTFDHCLETCKSNAELIHGLAATALQEHLLSDS